MVYREAHTLLEDLAEATLTGTRKEYFAELATAPLLIIDDLGMRKLAHTAAEDVAGADHAGEYERASTLLTSNRPVDDWGKLLGDTAAVTALLDRLLHHAHVLKCGPLGAGGRSCRPISPTRERSRTHWPRQPRELPVLTCPQIAGFQLSTEAVVGDEPREPQ